ncbi:MAG: tRNA (adenosine(37)-N6)-dimethylallyltransferase MiaA [Gemmataceae bacterium]|nr:tRNA (adenosine(37)-N6)-dimethylallyltransferase MiaA [Gemmataceae bacterium]
MDPSTFRDSLILAGPTGSGKSALALALAPRLGAEVVCMDSMTLYRGMDIGTAKPTAEDRALVPHHLLDVLEPWESATVAWWLAEAARCVRDIGSRGKRALFVGGTALYLKALLHGLFDGPEADSALRARLEAVPAEELHARLRTVDPASAERIHPNNVRRVVRALEVHELTGRPLSAHQTQWERSAEQDVPDRCLCLDLPRAELHERINARVERMMEAGLAEETARLRGLSPPPSREAMQALGYKELFPYLDGTRTRAEAVADLQARSRQFAKRQMTWFRHLEGCRLVRPDEVEGIWAG